MDHLFSIQHSYLIPLLPLLGAAVAGFLGARGLKQQSHWPIWLGVGASAVLSIWLLVDMLGLWRQMGGHAELAWNQNWYTWITAGNFNANAGFYFDPLTAVMLVVVTGIGFLITIFSKGYMHGESGYFRFFAYLGLFIFMMTVLVMGNNFLMLYLGWEGVGLCSYLLIGYYYERPAAREAAKKAFLVNRIGDFGFGVGIMLIFLAFGTIGYFDGGAGNAGVLNLAALPQTLSPFQLKALQWIPFLLMLGAFGKSAQFPLYVWLPDAMEGPTPVSALIHAATMVTAGVYMLVRCGTLFVANEAALWTVAAVGAFTALFAATIALRQFDLKKVFAYSTISQLGFMFVAAAVLAPVAGIFHLVTHAFFKALLFLSSGVVMHAMGGELDMSKMSGLRHRLPWTRLFMLAGCLALAGFPFFSGFFSKDEIVAAAWERSPLLGIVLLVTALLTAYYTFRLYFRVFEGPEILPAAAASPGHASHGDQPGHDRIHPHNHEPLSMMLPLAILTLGALLAGYLNWPPRHASLGDFLGQSLSLQLSHKLAEAHYGASHVADVPFGAEDLSDPRSREQVHALHQWLMIVSGAVAALGIYLAYLLHCKYRQIDQRLVARFPAMVRLLEAKYYVDEIYQAGIVEPLRMLGRLFFAMDRIIIDGLVWLVGFVPQLSGFTLKLTTQRGYLQGYALAMLLGIAVILLLVLL